MNNIENIVKIVERIEEKIVAIEQMCLELEHSIKGSIEYKAIPAEEPVILNNNEESIAFRR